MYRTVDSPTAKKSLVSRVDDGVDPLINDVTQHDFELHDQAQNYSAYMQDEIVGEPATWILRLKDEDLGTLTWTGTDQPFHQYRFDPTPAFESMQRLFEEELQLLNADRMIEWDAAYQRVLDTGLRIESPDGSHCLLEFILHIDGGFAWMRYLDPGETF